VIPESKRAAVERALLQTFGTPAPDEIVLLTGGLSSALVFKIIVKGKSCLLRLIMRVDEGNAPARQFVCMKLAAEAGIAPPVLYADADDAVSITGFVETRPFAGVPLLPHLAQTVRAIHALPLFPRLEGKVNGADMFMQKFQASGMLPESATSEHFRYYAEIRRACSEQEADLVSSHNDLNPGNLLFDGRRLWVVDWEAAFATERYVDLAIVANFFISQEAEEEAFLRAYFEGEVSRYQRARFFLMRPVCHMVFAFAFLRLATAAGPRGDARSAEAASGKTAPGLKDFYVLLRTGEVSLGSPEGQLLYAKVLLNESLRMMKTPRFAESLGIALRGPLA
jgi:aminoglycoside phosphotransferase (APT) family kinase protein